jgi:diguanylate cyclase (GGDEF)-like protein
LTVVKPQLDSRGDSKREVSGEFESVEPLEAARTDRDTRGKRFQYAAIGAVLGLGAPGGWALIRLFAGNVSGWAGEVGSHAGLYAYLTISTSVAFAAFGAVLGTFADERARLLQELRQLALTDSLTGLRNARDYRMRLGEECARAQRSGSLLTVIAFDLDLFKRINDRYGHALGDWALAQVGFVVRRCIREEDVACRVGGEELAIICGGANDAAGLELAERIRREIEAILLPAPAEAEHLTASFGVASFRPGESPEQLTRQADRAMYEAKRAGRNRVQLAIRNHPGP